MSVQINRCAFIVSASGSVGGIRGPDHYRIRRVWIDGPELSTASRERDGGEGVALEDELGEGGFHGKRALMERLISLFGPLVMIVLDSALVCPLLRKSLVRIPIMFHGYQHNRVGLRLPQFLLDVADGIAKASNTVGQ